MLEHDCRHRIDFPFHREVDNWSLHHLVLHCPISKLEHFLKEIVPELNRHFWRRSIYRPLIISTVKSRFLFSHMLFSTNASLIWLTP